MPPRWTVAAILAAWLATTAALLWREVGERYFLEQPPALSIDIGDEADNVRPNVLWTLYRGDREIGKATTTIRYRPETDTFDQIGRITRLEIDFPVLGLGTLVMSVPEMNTRTEVTRAGRVRSSGVSGEFGIALTVGGVPLQSVEFTANLEGVANGQTLEWTGRLAAAGKAAGSWEFAPPLVPTPVPSESVVNPMQPVTRIRGLRPGQTWEQSLVDPLADAMRASLPKLIAEAGKNFGAKGIDLDKLGLPLGGEPMVLRATVLRETQELTYKKVTDVCRVIEYRAGDTVVARTWVGVADELVRRQEAFQAGETLILQREDPERGETTR